MFKVKSSLILLAMFITILLAYTFCQTIKVSVVEGVWRAMRATSVDNCQLRLCGWSQLPQSLYEERELDAVIEKAMAGFGIQPDNYKITVLTIDNLPMVRAEAMDTNKRLAITAQTVKSAGIKKELQTYLSVNLEAEVNNEASTSQFRRSLERVFQDTGGQARITTCLVGRLNGKLSNGELLEKFLSAGKAIWAIPVDTLIQQGFVNKIYFSPILPEWILAGYKPLNLNMATRYSSADNYTYIIIGSPVIIGEY